MPQLWKSTADLRMAAEAVFENLRKHMIDVNEAKVLGAQIRTASQLTALELEASRIAKRDIGKALSDEKDKLSSVRLS